MILRNGLLLVCVAALAAGCGIRIGTNAEKDLGFGRIVGNIQAARGKNAPEPQQQAKLTRAALNQIDKNLIRVKFTRYNIETIMTEVASRDGVKTYLSTTQQTVSLEDGVLRTTRGLPYDLLESDYENDPSRTYRFLSATNAMNELKVTCSTETEGREAIEIVERSYNTTVTAETCRGQGFAFKNRYWTAGGTIWKSQQWIGPTHGFAVIEKLN